MIEVHNVLKGFAKDKIPRPNGWSVILFLAFFDIMGQDLVDLVNETKISRKVACALSATFITLIPKGENKCNFNENRQIYLCNVMYKLISKMRKTVKIEHLTI